VTTDDATVTGMAGRYATALHELADESGTVDTVLADLGRFEALIAESDDLKRLVRSPVFSADEQLAAISAILDRAGIGGLAGNFIKFAASNRRLFAVEGMIRAFRALVARARGEATAEVTVAEPLSEARMNELRAALRDTSGRDVHVDVTVDPAIIGGMIVKLGSRMIDSSLRTRLNAIHQAMKEVR
jgi:F-type H+-transporting ATPase subunit delta